MSALHHFERQPARRSIDDVSAQDFTVEFDVEGTRYSLAQMLATNVDDPGFCEWARAAKPGEFFPGVIACQCIAAGDLSEADLRSIDKAFEQTKTPAGRDRAAFDATYAQNHLRRCQGRM
jgi:hypothetical protein